MKTNYLGWAEVDPKDDATAGAMCSWKITYHVGTYGIDDGGSIRLARRSVSDLQRPQFTDPSASGYTTATTTRDVRLDYSYSGRGHIRPFSSAIQVNVRDGSLYPGDTVTITLGDRAQGSPGIRAQTFRETEHIFKVLVDAFGTGKFSEVPDTPRIRVKGGPADSVEVVAPSQVKAGEQFSVTVRALDSYGNISEEYDGKVSLSGVDGLPAGYRFSESDRGVKRFTGLTLHGNGVHRVHVQDDQGRAADSNPVEVMTELPPLRLFWGDMHGQTKQTVGTGDVDQYFSFARDSAAMDFSGWQGNDFQVTKELWSLIQRKTCEYHKPGRFVTFLGYEWSGLTPAGGDHNIYFLGDKAKIHRSDHWLIDDTSDEDTDRYPVDKLWEEFKGRKDVMAIPHVGGRHANLDFHDPERTPLIEVHSHHGTFEWFLEDALRRGLKVGFIAASDDHTCRPGLTRTSENFTTTGGYTGVYARELTREALWEAFWARRCYGTTGERIMLDYDMDGHMMGEEYTSAKKPVINVRVTGTAPLHEVEVKRGTETVHRHTFKPRGDTLLKIEWMGARVKSRPKRVDWRGGLYIDKGRILDAQEYGFDYADQGVKQITNQRLEWTSTTGGDSDGVILKLDAPDDAAITFYSGPATFTFNPSTVKDEPYIVDLGPVNRKVRITRIPEEETPTEAEFTYTDVNPQQGVNPYWVKVTQSNGALAWGSPVYHHYTS